MATTRAARPGDAQQVARLHWRSAIVGYHHIFPPEAVPPTMEQLLARWRSWLDASRAEETRGFVAESEDRCIGVVLVGPDPRDPSLGHIARMYVAPERWGQGIGRSLYQAALAHFDRVGYQEATLWVLEANHRARSWYERLGWVPTGDRESVYAPASIDELCYKKLLRE